MLRILGFLGGVMAGLIFVFPLQLTIAFYKADGRYRRKK